MIILEISYSNYYLLSLALFLGLWGCVWTVNVERKRNREKGNIDWIITPKEIIKQKAIIVTANIAKIGIGIALGVVLGVGIREYQLNSNIVPYTDVLILPPSQPNTDFDIQPARMQPIPSKLCYSLVDWKFGEVLKDLIFEQKQDCKRIISYHRYGKGEQLNAAIPMR